MARDEDRRAADLDRYWDAVVRGSAGERAGTPERAMTVLIDRLHAHAHVPAASAPPRLFSDPEASWRELRRMTGTPERVARGPAISPSHPFHSNGRAGPLPTPVRTSRLSRGWASFQTALAALLVLLLAGGYLLFWQGRLNSPDVTAWLPASVTAALPAGYSEEILFHAAFAGDELAGGEREAILYQLTLPPGTRLENLSGIELACLCYQKTVVAGSGAEVIQSGTYTMQLDAPFWIQRGGFTAEKEEILSQDDVTLQARDVAIYHEYAASGEVRNTGDDPVVLTGVAIVDMVNRSSASDPLHVLPPGVRGEVLANTNPPDWQGFPPGPLTATLRRVTLPAETALPPFEPVGLETIRIESGSIAWGYIDSGTNATPSMWMTRYAGASVPFMSGPRPVQRVLETRGDEPAVLLVLSIEPAGPLAGTLGS